MSDAIALIGDGATFTVTRSASGGGVGSDGRASPPSTSPLTVVGLEHPLEGDELERLPDSLRAVEVKAFYTATPLLTADSNQLPDVVTIAGVPFEVQRVQAWGSTGNFGRYIVARKP